MLHISMKRLDLNLLCSMHKVGGGGQPDSDVKVDFLKIGIGKSEKSGWPPPPPHKVELNNFLLVTPILPIGERSHLSLGVNLNRQPTTAGIVVTIFTCKCGE